MRCRAADTGHRRTEAAVSGSDRGGFGIFVSAGVVAGGGAGSGQSRDGGFDRPRADGVIVS